MNVFSKLLQAVSDYETCWLVLKAAEQQGNDVTAAVSSRIAADRRRADERTATLTAQSKDPALPEVVRKLARDELARRHLAGEQRAFDLLGKTGRPGGQS